MASKGASQKEQINLALDAPIARALRLIAVRDGKSVPELLRPGIERLVRGRLKQDPDLANSVTALESSIVAEQIRVANKRGVTSITELRTTQDSVSEHPDQNSTERRLNP